jgi:N-acetylmuramoyl-L-alanine amidase
VVDNESKCPVSGKRKYASEGEALATAAHQIATANAPKELHAYLEPKLCETSTSLRGGTMFIKLVGALIALVAIGAQSVSAQQESQQLQPSGIAQGQSSSSSAKDTGDAKVCSRVTVNREEPLAGKPRRLPVKYIVIHSTGGPDCNPGRAFQSGTLHSNIKHFKDEVDKSKVSIHYLVDRDGTVVRMVPEDQIANHVYGYNPKSVGIELINNGNGQDPFPPKQVHALELLLGDLLSRYSLGPENVVAHADLEKRHYFCGKVDAGPRRLDPGSNFPWQEVRTYLNLPCRQNPQK